MAVAWTLFAFGGLYAWTLIPLGLIAATALFFNRPRPFKAHRGLDMLLVAALLSVAAQAVPVPHSVRATLSPQAETVERALEVGAPGEPAPALRALSIRPGATVNSAAYLVLTLLVFWMARDVFERGGFSTAARTIGTMGLVVSFIAVVQLAATPHLMYGLVPPADDNATPFGPFVNRNHMATWLLMAIPLVSGYLVTHVRARISGLPDRRLALARALDATTVWQLGAFVTMVSTLFLSLSRSGVLGLLVATTTGFVASYMKLGRLRIQWLAGAAIFLLLAATYLANFDALADRFAQAVDRGTERVEIWRQTLPIVRDFPLTGTGQGTFNRAMLVYQQGERRVLFNQAHNQYLQTAAEGGILVGLPALLGVMALAGLAVRQLRRDSTALFWARAGAASALVAVAVQSLWETGLTMPANGVLFAVCVALAVHDTRGESSSGSVGR